MIPVTTVGSRDLKDKNVYLSLCVVGERLVEGGCRVREGDAIGSDDAFQKGALRQAKRMGLSESDVRETFLAKLRTQRSEHDPVRGIYGYPKLPHQDLAMKIAGAMHPAWENCNEYARLLHARNVYQVMGKDLLEPSKMFFCYAPPTSEGSVTGGTRTAFELAKHLGIPKNNFYGSDGDFDTELAKRLFPNKKLVVFQAFNYEVSEKLYRVIKDYGLINPKFLKQFQQVYGLTS